ncbi:Uncharacterised protein [Peptostreptococcus anaerobius]|uniref:Uncharacterized protein n=1 Tax=Peptostreptococcus anaerobius TaxID=1261 RepID=A0A379CEF7_9FIRM|nr:hypothetical protein [Peptostreptococcus anaerobius]SFM75597.1 hypothetical protein SAMN05660467_00372 [Peptostreptococcus anaerobius]SUB60588.1 Uncharacterised protein [Peptostreptococcus anaerobius]
MFDENKKLLKFEDEEFNLEVDYQNKNSVSQDTIERVSIKDSSTDDILDVEYENKKTDQSEGFDLDDSGHIPMLEQLMASSNKNVYYEEDQGDHYEEDEDYYEEDEDYYEENEDDFVPIGLKKPKPRMYDDSLDSIRTVLLDEYEDDFVDNESDLENLSINFYDDDNEGIESKKLEQLERIASALERIADMMEKR